MRMGTGFRRLGLFAELWHFMKVSRKWWLGPILGFLVFLALIVVLFESSAIAPFIYSLF
jgi:hypothetical protein